MKKPIPGIAFIITACVMYGISRILTSVTQGGNDPTAAGLSAILAFATLIVGAFGIYRLIAGRATRK